MKVSRKRLDIEMNVGWVRESDYHTMGDCSVVFELPQNKVAALQQYGEILG